MAFMTAPASAAGSNEPRTPILGFNAKSGRIFLLDRTQDATGEWSSVKTDVTMQQPPFLVDFGRLETGWIHFSANQAPVFVMAPHGEACPAQPASPGTTNTGRPLRFKAGFRLPVVSNAIGGVREFAGNSGALINGMNELHSAYEIAPEAREGKIPAVRMIDTIEIEAGQSSNYQPVFQIIGWASRPATLGPRSVPAPGAAAAARVPPTPPAARTAPVRAAAEAWNEIATAFVNGNHAPVVGTGWADSEIPF